ncbi:MAG: tandem-95 repeat protein, partial [Calditrichaeota bacterium]|nr:tandem-95 repeat protein [Calditrichota bacterium]
MKLLKTTVISLLLIVSAGYAQHFQFRITGENASILVQNAFIDGTRLVVNDEIGVFTPGGLCAGGSRVAQGQIAIQVIPYGDDEWTQEIDGFRANEVFAFRIWDASAQVESPATPDRYLNQFGQPVIGRYSVNAVFIVPNLNAISPNRPPVLAEIGPQLVDEGATLNITLQASDPDNNALTFSAQNLPAGASLQDDQFTWTPSYDQSGEHSVTFRVTDDGAPPAFDEETVVITVRNVNRAPVLQSIQPQSVREGQLLTIQLSASDPDNDNLYYSMTDAPEGAGLDGAVFSWTPSYDQSGEWTIRFMATDDGEPNLSDEKTAVITVENVNRAPELAQIGNREVNEGAVLEFDLSADDPDGDQLSYSAENLPDGAFLNINRFAWTPNYSQSGEYQMTFRVTDNGSPNLSDEEVVIITVANVNRPPVLAGIGNKEVDEGSVLEFDLSANDPDGDAVTYSAFNLPEGAILEAGRFHWQPTYDQAGVYEVTFRVTDNGQPALFDEETITITVRNVQPPEQLHFQFRITGESASILVQNAFIAGERLVANDEIGVFTPDGLCAGGSRVAQGQIAIQVIPYGDDEWTQETDGFRANEVFAFRIWDASAQREIPAAPDRYLNQFGQPVTGQYSVNAIFIIPNLNTIQQNRPPVLAGIGNREVDEGSELLIELSAFDPDDDELTFSGFDLPAGSALAGNVFHWTPDYGQAGNYAVTFRVTDDGTPNLSDEDTIVITVGDINRPPVLAGIGNREVDESSELLIELTASDPDDDGLTFSGVDLPAGSMLAGNVFRWTPSYDQAGNYAVTFRVTDDGTPNLSDEETIVITVGDINRPPVLAGIGNREVDEGRELLIELSAFDPDDDGLTFSVVDPPAGSSLAGNVFRWTPDYGQAGNYAVTFRVTDDGTPNLSDEERIVITVNNVNRPPELAEIGNREVDEGREL